MVKIPFISALVAGLALIAGQAEALTQQETNGLSVLGTLDAPHLPKFLDGPLINGKPWNKRDNQTNYYKDMPNTGVVRKYEFTITREYIAPDGYRRQSLLVNGQFPGPLVEANWGDQIHITVHNNITGPEEGVALHTHGLLHRHKPWEDGVPSVSQCPIAPGTSYTYKLTADMYGTSWYHSHYATQYAGGMLGPLVIHGPETEDYDIDIGPVMLQDHYHETYAHFTERFMMVNLTGGGLNSQSNLINGKMNFDCKNVTLGDKTPCDSNAGYSKFRFQKGKKHLLRLINSGGEGMQRFSIDGHMLKVISNDFVPIEPYETKVVTLGVGQRSDVIVEAIGDKGDSFWMRSTISLCNAGIKPNAYAGIYYDDADSTKDPKTISWGIPDPLTCQNDALEKTVPLMKMAVPEPDLTIHINYTWGFDAKSIITFTTNGVKFAGDNTLPTLLQANKGIQNFTKSTNVEFTKNAKSVRVIAQNSVPEPHPMHLHGFNMYILEQGGPKAKYNGTVTRASNPQRRDTFITAPLGYTVFQFDAAENPGMWPFHCHTAIHSAVGMFMQFSVQPDETKKYQIPDSVQENCKAWKSWTTSEGGPKGMDAAARKRR